MATLKSMMSGVGGDWVNGCLVVIDNGPVPVVGSGVVGW